MLRLNLSSPGIVSVWVPLCIFQTIFSVPCTPRGERQEREIYFETELRLYFVSCEAFFSLSVDIGCGPGSLCWDRQIKGLVDLYSLWDGPGVRQDVAHGLAWWCASADPLPSTHLSFAGSHWLRKWKRWWWWAIIILAPKWICAAAGDPDTLYEGSFTYSVTIHEVVVFYVWINLMNFHSGIIRVVCLFMYSSIHVFKQVVQQSVCYCRHVSWSLVEIDKVLWIHFIDCRRSADFPAQESEPV